VGLPVSGRRRTPGLRREEVAMLADLGVTWYTFLEQGRPIRISSDALQRIAQALRLNDHETGHLFTLAERTPPPRRKAEDVAPALRRWIEALGPIPCWLYNSYWEPLAWNRAANLVWFDCDAVEPGERNLMWQTFLSPESRKRIHNWQSICRASVSALRFSYGENQDDPRFDALIQRLSEGSPEFRTLWRQHDVNPRRSWSITLEHPTAGPLEFIGLAMQPVPVPGLRLALLTGAPGTGTTERLTALLNASVDGHRVPTPAFA
jgi:hypothetical protein